MKPLYEQYRPRTFADVLGQDRAIKQLETIGKRGGYAGRAYWIAGQSGTGKTTLGKIIAEKIAEPFFIDELDAAQLTPARLRNIEDSSQLYGGWSTLHGRAYIINEAHGLSKEAIRQLLVILERIPKHVLYAFTTTSNAQEDLFEQHIDANPFLSRCIELYLSRRGLSDLFAARAKQIAQAENLDGASIEAYKKLVQDCRNNMRQVLQAVEQGRMLNPGTE